MFKVGFRAVDGNQRGVANRETLLRWQVIRLLKNHGYFCLEFTEKRLHNLSTIVDITWSFLVYVELTTNTRCIYPISWWAIINAKHSTIYEFVLIKVKMTRH